MRPPLIRRQQRSVRHRSRERGVTMALVALAIVGVLAMAALSIDIGALYQASAEAQRSADSGALAAARIISMQGITGDPNNSANSWQMICQGETSPASIAANNAAQQNLIGGNAPSKIKVYYGTNAGVGTNEDCSTLGSAFGINPVVEVYVQQANLPTFFARVFGLIPGGTSSNSGVSATAAAEAFNPSNSASLTGGQLVPVRPRCVKPLVVPNLDPLHTIPCTNNCSPIVNNTTGQIFTPGINAINAGVIGERFWLVPDCQVGPTNCQLLVQSPTQQPIANTNPFGLTNSLEYVPGQLPPTFTAIPSCASGANPFAQAIAGCDQSTAYQCGVQQMNTLDLSENPETTDAQTGVQCLIHQSGTVTQDTLAPGGAGTPSYPFQIQAGANDPLLNAGVAANGDITSSPSIVSIPIFDNTQTVTSGTTTTITVVGFLQVFINAVDTTGDVDVTVLNVSGCGNGQTTPVNAQPVYGTSPVPVRLITLPPPSS